MGTLGYSDASQRAMLDEVLRREREFHDAWAKVIDRDGIHVPDYFEACTAPENRFILRHLGDIRGKYILDLGCGAGENIAKHTKVDMIWVAGRSPTLVSQNLKATTLTYLAIVFISLCGVPNV